MSKNIRRGFNFKRFSILFASSFLFILSALAIASASASTTNSNESEVSVSLPEVINLRILNNTATTEIDNLMIGLNPTPNGAFTKDTFIAEASTSNSTGYTLYMTSTGKDHNNTYTTSLINTDSSIDPSQGSVPTLPANSTITESDFKVSNSTYKNKWGYSLNSVNVVASTNNGTTTNTLTQVTNPSTITYADIPVNGISREIDEKASATDHGLTPVTIGANVSSATPSGTYKNTLELTAIANPIPVQYSLTFNKNPNNNVPESTISNMPTTNPMTGSSLASSYDFTIPSTAPTTSASGYVFKEWNTKADGTGTPYNPGATYTALAGDPDTENTTLYAIWSQHTYTITYNCNTGSNCPTNSTITTPDDPYTYTIPNTSPSKTDYKFTGYLGSDSITYQPGDTITLTSSKLSVTLTAQWEESNFWTIRYMQDMTPQICSSLYTPSAVIGTNARPILLRSDGVTSVSGAGSAVIIDDAAGYRATVTADNQPYVAQRTLYDIRDNNSYTVRKLADGNCWMTTNLNLSLSTNTPIIGSKNDGSAFTYTPTSCGGTNGSCAMNGNTMAGSGMWYYSWYAATAGEGKTTDVNVDVDGSICPVGWRLPPNYSAQVNKSFGGLTNSYGVTSDGENGNSSNVMVSYPINITRDKCRYNGGNPDYGVHGYYQSSTAAESSDSSYVFAQSDPTGNNGNNKVYPQGVDPKGYAFNIRCVAL